MKIYVHACAYQQQIDINLYVIMRYIISLLPPVLNVWGNGN